MQQGAEQPEKGISFFNRRSGQLEEEQVYGEGFLRWTYETPLGRLALHALAKRSVFSRWYGWRMDRPASRAKIEPFIAQYGLDPASFADPVEAFGSFNEFFSRKLKTEARPIDPDPAALVFPADGRHLLLPRVADNDFLVKGVRFDLEQLLGDRSLAERYREGALLISRLCPVDYHRYHLPCGGRLGPVRRLNGPLYSVSPIALWQRPSILWENLRYCAALESPTFGTVQYLEVGATCVGSVVHTQAEGEYEKGDEKGCFLFGGSTVITLFEPGRVRWSKDLLEWSGKGIELYALMGERAGIASGQSPD